MDVGCSIGDGGAVVRFEVVLPEPHRLQFQPVPLAPLLVDRVHALEGRPVPGDEERRLALGLMDLLDRPRPAAQGDVGEVGVTDAVLDPHLVPRLEAGRDGFGSSCGPWVTPRRDRPLRSAGMIGDQVPSESTSWSNTRYQFSGLHELAIDLDREGPPGLVHPAGQGPSRVEAADLQHRADRLGLPLAGALGDPERLVDGRQLQVGLAGCGRRGS